MWKSNILSNLHRSSSNFTFSTRFPKNKKKPKFLLQSKKTSAKRFNAPDRLKLAKFPSNSLFKKPKKLIHSDNPISEKVLAHKAKFALVNPMVTSTDIDSVEKSKSDEKSSLDFSLHLSPQLITGLESLYKITKPTSIQELILSKVFNTKKNLLLASETGSGKTLAYLLPVFQSLKNEEDLLKKQTPLPEDEIQHALEAITSDGDVVTCTSGLSQVRKLARPRAIILVPSRELVFQITEIAKSLSHYCRLRVLGIHSRTRPSDLKKSLASSPVDVLITTPGALLIQMSEGIMAYSQTKIMVLDEADSLFDRGFSQEVDKIVNGVTLSSEKTQRELKFIISSATLPKSLMKRLKAQFQDNLEVCSTPGLHHTTIKGVSQTFLRLDASTTKNNLLLDVLKKDVIKETRILIFCNTKKSCEALTSFLISKEYDVLQVSSDATIDERKDSWVKFNEKKQVGSCKIMVATDMASRGMDTINCGHVILYDFPQTTIDYIHRTGRVGRMGRKGKVTSFIGKKDAKLADGIEYAVRRGLFLTE